MANNSIFGSDDHSCWGKAKAIQKRLGIMLGLDSHDVISEMCRMWGTANPTEFYDVMNNKTDAELRSDVDRAIELVRRRKKLMGISIEQQVVSAYA